MLSIIIPTLNEEKYLPKLLESIKKQKFLGYEIVVADAGSIDKTIEIAKNYNCQIARGGLPAVGRNNGAKKAKGDLFLFLDADGILPENFLVNSFNEFEKRELKVASFPLIPCEKNKAIKICFDTFYNVPVRLLEKTLPHSAMGILIGRELFEKIGGFDETIKLAEDHDLGRRASKIGKYGVLKSTHIFISTRRFETDGWLRTSLRYLFCGAYMIFRGPVRKDIIKYEFNHYSKNKKNEV